MNDDKKQVVGVETDRTVADVLRALLLKPATELGSFLGDGLGILADKVRDRRQKNVELAMQSARTQLEVRGVEIKDITPIDEVDAFQVLTGMSLSSDSRIRSLWAGLLASAMDPQNAHTIERSVISVIEALSPQDAKILNFLVFAELVLREQERAINGYYSRIYEVNQKALEKDEKDERLNKLKSELNEIQAHNTQRIMALATRDGILFTRSLTKHQDWHLNLDRLGLIELSDAVWPRVGRLRGGSSDPQAARAFSDIEEKLTDIEKRLPARLNDAYLVEDGKWHVSLGVKLSPFGRHFARACGLFDQPPDFYSKGQEEDLTGGS
jgi:Abortive infection alpha